MTDAEKLTVLKGDLQLMNTANDAYLAQLLTFAVSLMQREGIEIVADDFETDMIQIHYAAYLFRKRSGTDTAMPRFLRYELNNLLLSQKGATDNDI